jgi:micrococcal nuclease
MHILRTVCLVAVAAGNILQPSSRPEVVLVTSVIDGQTIAAQTVGHVRLLGIEAPRPSQASSGFNNIGRDSKARLEGIVIRRFVRLEFEAHGKSSRRSAAYVVLEDGTFVNAVLVREGLARVSGHQSTGRMLELQRAEAEAKARRLGIWK